jgi:hypothetical protein
MDGCNPVKLLILIGSVLKPNIKTLKYNDTTVYQQIIGSTIYLLNYICPNISYIVG